MPDKRKAAALVGGLVGIGLAGYLVHKYLEQLATPAIPPTAPAVPTPPTPPAPAPGLPVAIRSLGPAYLTQNVGVMLVGTPCVDQRTVVFHCDEEWRTNRFCRATMRFQVVDAAGKGVPGVEVWLYTDPMPDPSRYSGILRLDGGIWTPTNPLEKVTDGDGVVSVELTYRYGKDDRFLTLMMDTGVVCTVWWCFPPIPRYDAYPCDGCYVGALHFATNCRGGGETVPWPNRVHAQVAGVAPVGGTYTYEIAYCKFRTRWL